MLIGQPSMQRLGLAVLPAGTAREVFKHTTLRFYFGEPTPLGSLKLKQVRLDQVLVTGQGIEKAGGAGQNVADDHAAGCIEPVGSLPSTTRSAASPIIIPIRRTTRPAVSEEM